jgi:hypothetical protein
MKRVFTPLAQSQVCEPALSSATVSHGRAGLAGSDDALQRPWQRRESQDNPRQRGQLLAVRAHNSPRYIGGEWRARKRYHVDAVDDLVRTLGIGRTDSPSGGGGTFRFRNNEVGVGKSAQDFGAPKWADAQTAKLEDAAPASILRRSVTSVRPARKRAQARSKPVINHETAPKNMLAAVPATLVIRGI